MRCVLVLYVKFPTIDVGNPFLKKVKIINYFYYKDLGVFPLLAVRCFFLQMGKNSDYLNKKAHQVIRVGFR
ncbi:hypothetical protein CBW55_19765 [Yersinia intermedia]|nr:hypothetical protein CBW55_19765 [Yersinia intermedia]